MTPGLFCRRGLFLSLLVIIATTGTIAIAQTEPRPMGTLQRPVLEIGSTGVEVSELQATLKLLGYYTGPVNGTYSEETAAAVSAFQTDAGLSANGVVNQSTWNRLLPASPVAEEPKSSSDCVCSTENTTTIDPNDMGFPILQLGMRGDAVRGLQERLRAKGFLGVSPDGVFGSSTEAAVIAAQVEYELEPDGIVGTQTWFVLLQD